MDTLQNLTVNNINDKKARLVNEMLRGDKRLKTEII